MEETKKQKVAWVLGGGGQLGAHEIGMIKALVETKHMPEAIYGTSIGAINGAVMASHPPEEAIVELGKVWRATGAEEIFTGGLFGVVRTMAKSRTHLHGNESFRRLLELGLPETFAETTIPFQCVAASIERASEHWFTAGPLVSAVLASSAVPGLLPPVEIDGEHFIDGGIVNSIPVSRAIEEGADEVFVLQVGRIEQPLQVPKWPWEVGLIAFEVARRHRFQSDLAGLPSSTKLHVLPSGASDEKLTGFSQIRYRNFNQVGERIDRAYQASLQYLEGLK